ncbi:MAG: L-threonylcarbamoyladenylate synthase [Acidimicrobiales bacterium]
MTRLTIDETVAALARGAVVALPTDTVYGLGASIAFPDALEALFSLKRRPDRVALPVVAARASDLDELVDGWPEGAARLIAAYWPGPLTLVVEAREPLAARVHSATTRVGFRVPDDPVLGAVLAASGPLALTSANGHGEPPCVTADGVLAAFVGRAQLAGVLDGGRRDAPVSSVVEFAGDGWRVVRVGAITLEQLAATLA